MNADPARPSYTELNAILDQARRPSGSPTPITDAQLLGLQRRWTTMLSARLDQALEDAGPGPLTDTVAEAWRRLATDQPVLRSVLENGLRRPTLTDALDTEHRMLALAAGLAGLDEPERRAVTLGRELRDRLGRQRRVLRAREWRVRPEPYSPLTSAQRIS